MNINNDIFLADRMDVDCFAHEFDCGDCMGKRFSSVVTGKEESDCYYFLEWYRKGENYERPKYRP